VPELNNYCVYAHYKSLENNIPFYIGMGSIRRSKSKNPRSRHWRNIVNKHGYYVKLLAERLFQEDAWNLEIKLIGMFGRLDLKTGPLINKNAGGNTMPTRAGIPHTKEWCENRSQKMKGCVGFFKNKKHNKESKRIMRVKKLGKSRSSSFKKDCSERMKGSGNNFYGKAHKKETKHIMREKKLGRIWIVNILSGETSLFDPIVDIPENWIAGRKLRV
jgi:hypothetical protein